MIFSSIDMYASFQISKVKEIMYLPAVKYDNEIKTPAPAPSWIPLATFKFFQASNGWNYGSLQMQTYTKEPWCLLNRNEIPMDGLSSLTLALVSGNIIMYTVEVEWIC